MTEAIRTPQPIPEPPARPVDAAQMPPEPPPLEYSMPQVGYPLSKPHIDMRIGELAKTIEQWAPQAVEFADWLDSITDDTLQKFPFGYSAGDEKLLRSAAADPRTVAQVYLGKEAAQRTDHGRHSRQLAGLFRL